MTKINYNNEMKQDIHNALVNAFSSLGMVETRKITNFEKVETTKGSNNGIAFIAINADDADKTLRRAECYLIANGIVVWCGKSTPVYDVLTAMNCKYTQSGGQRRFVLTLKEVSDLSLITVKQGMLHKEPAKPKKSRTRKTKQMEKVGA